MGAITMAKINYLEVLRASYPAITFIEADDFRWSPDSSTVFIGTLDAPESVYLLLHETGHALAQHTTYTQDINLLKLEREAWNIARTTLAPPLEVTIPEDFIENMLDTYRDWLYARSLCPMCSANGVQENESHYRCLACGTGWRVNDARQCNLRRYITK